MLILKDNLWKLFRWKEKESQRKFIEVLWIGYAGRGYDCGEAWEIEKFF